MMDRNTHPCARKPMGMAKSPTKAHPAGALGAASYFGRRIDARAATAKRGYQKEARQQTAPLVTILVFPSNARQAKFQAVDGLFGSKSGL